jgi:hypothetical protein
MTQSDSQKITQAWVVFSGQADLAWLKILKPGFRHCSVLLHDGVHWVSFDPLSNYTEISVHDVPAEFDMPAWLRARGHVVVETQRAFPSKPAPFDFFSCVSAVKRVLGLHAQLIFTPWQLYCHLIQHRPFRAQPIDKGEIAWEV